MSSLDNRVKVLEDELRILKDEIHQTLLEIQEQILIHYYPDLRSDESLARPVTTPSRPKEASDSMASGVERAALEETAADTKKEAAPTPAEPLAPMIMQMPPPTALQTPASQAPAQVVAPAPSPAPALPVGQAPAKPVIATPAPSAVQALAQMPALAMGQTSTDEGSGAFQDATVARLMAWASGSVERIGRERTIKAIQVYAQGGHLAPSVTDALLQLISLSDEEPQIERVSLRAISDALTKLEEALGIKSDTASTRRLMEETTVG